MTDFLDALRAWFYRGASDMTHDETGLDAFDAWISRYAITPRDASELPHVWGNSDSVPLDVYEAEDGVLVQQGGEYAWLIPAAVLDEMPPVQPSRLIV